MTTVVLGAGHCRHDGAGRAGQGRHEGSSAGDTLWQVSRTDRPSP